MSDQDREMVQMVEQAVEHALIKSSREIGREALSPKFLLALSIAAITFIIWLVRLEGKVDRNSDSVIAHNTTPFHTGTQMMQIELAKINEQLGFLRDTVSKLEGGQEDLKKKLGATSDRNPQ